MFKKRKSIRSYLPTPIEDKVLIEIMDAARSAPSAGNVQPWHFIIVKNKEKRERIAKGCRYGKFLSESPIIIIGCGDKLSSKWYAIDTSIAIEHIVLAATTYGLGTCWIGMFDEEDICKIVNLPDNFEIIALLSIGFPKEQTDFWAKILHFIRPKKKLLDILSLEIYGKGCDY